MKRNNTFLTLLLGNIFAIVGSALLSITPISLDVPHALYGYKVVAGHFQYHAAERAHRLNPGLAKRAYPSDRP